VSLPLSSQNGSAVRINGRTIIEADSISSNSKEETEPEIQDTRGKPHSISLENFLPFTKLVKIIKNKN